MSPRPESNNSRFRHPRNLCFPASRGEEGLATLIALVALGLFSVIALYASFNATLQVRMSDNYEAQVQAILAARAGLDHTREAMRGIANDDMLLGPDGTNDTSGSYLTTARKASFRNPLTWDLARAVDILNPAADVAGLADDGLLNTGHYNTTNGTEIVPKTGIALSAPDPYGGGTITTTRYFVRIADNNGEATELAADGGQSISRRRWGDPDTVHGCGPDLPRHRRLDREAQFRSGGGREIQSPVNLGPGCAVCSRRERRSAFRSRHV